MFWVTSARLHVRFRNNPVESRGSLPARSRERMYRKNAARKGGSDQEEHRQEHALVLNLVVRLVAELLDSLHWRARREERLSLGGVRLRRLGPKNR